MSFSEKLGNAKLVSSDVSVCLDPEVYVEYSNRLTVLQEAIADSENAKDKRLAKSSDTEAVAAARKALEEYTPTYEGVSVTLKVTALPAGELVALRAEHLGEDSDETSQLGFVKAVLQKSAKYVEGGKESSLTEAQWSKLFDTIPFGEWSTLREAVGVVNDQKFGSNYELLKGLSEATLNSGETSK